MKARRYPESGFTEYVILLHGLGRTRRSMRPIEKSLSAHGYVVVNIDYPSRKHPIEYLADKFLGDVLEPYKKIPNARIHFVTHSLGGIVVRYYLKHHRLSGLGRVVMLSPPNQGSEVVDWLKEKRLFKKIHGPAGQQLSASANSFLLDLGPVTFELGIITGDKAFEPWAPFIIPGPNDGRVSVERAKVQGMKDLIVLPHGHTFIMRSPGVIGQVLNFLGHGLFKHASSATKTLKSDHSFRTGL
jgi:triacylglycerol lipase